MSGAARTPDFLDRTIDKAFGQQTAIDPRLPSVFEPRGFGLDAQEPAAATRMAAARGETRTQAGDGMALADDDPRRDPRDTTAEIPPPVLRGLSTARREPAASSDTAEPLGVAATPTTANPIQRPQQTAPLRPAPGVAGVAPSVPAATAKRSLAAEDQDPRLPRATASTPSAAVTTPGPAKIRQPDTQAPQRPVATSGERGVRRNAAESLPPAGARIPGAAAKFPMMEHGTSALRPLGDEITVKRPTPEPGAATPPSRAAAPQPPGSERQAASTENGFAPQGALLPVAMSIRRAPLAQPLAAQRRAAPQDGEAREASPSVVNVTIGRVEVRAAGAPAQRGGDKREPKPLSLSDYLKKRSER